ncbi:hypothetical protein N9413_11135 [Paracoccaceae bacterium]|nr:hypothetical protein [Paracoccaceae bacterium]
MKIDLYMPRLDTAFKNLGPVPKERGPIAPIRVHWAKFIKALYERHQKLGHDVRLLELPLWQITPSLVKKTSPNAHRIYVPHKMRENWWLDRRVYYFMQMVIPNIFSIDNHGWCASASSYPIQPDGCENSGVYEMLSKRIKLNTSKFKQPEYKRTGLEPGYVFFPCQLPHDETIKYHSDVEVGTALRQTMDWIRKFNLNRPKDTKPRSIVVKGHPANPNAMGPLQEVYHELAREMPGMAHWVDDMSIHQLIADARVVVSVNSGVGLEAILHGKSIFVFGKADYDTIQHNNSKNVSSDKETALELSYRELSSENLKIYKKFIDSWYNTHYDYEDLNSFKKII